MKTTKTADRDASMNAAYLSVAAVGVLLLGVSGALFGARLAAAVALGVLLAVSNLWVLERLVRVYLQSEGGKWAGVALLKAIVLFALVAILVKVGAVEVLPLVIGFGALPLGITIAGFLPLPATREES